MYLLKRQIEYLHHWNGYQ